jgi:hypothetical protein
MKQLVQHVAYGMNGNDIPKMTNKQLMSAFFLADTNLPTIHRDYHLAIKNNMERIADEFSDRVDLSKGSAKIKLEVHLIVMKVIVKRFYE